MADVLKQALEGGILRLTLNRPDRYNAFDNELSFALIDALKQAQRNDEVRVIVLTGEGKAFCSGQDLKDVAGQAGVRNLGDSVRDRYNPMIRLVYNMPKPTVCRLNGVAAGAGAGLALGCDYVVMAEQASLLFAFANIGLVPDTASSYILPRLVGARKAFEFAALGEKIPAATALELGMVNRVVPAAELDEATNTIAERFAKAPTKALGYIKKMLKESSERDLEAALENEMHYQRLAGRTQDYKEGVTAFNEKRKAEFKGK